VRQRQLRLQQRLNKNLLHCQLVAQQLFEVQHENLRQQLDLPHRAEKLRRLRVLLLKLQHQQLLRQLFIGFQDLKVHHDFLLITRF